MPVTPTGTPVTRVVMSAIGGVRAMAVVDALRIVGAATVVNAVTIVGATTAVNPVSADWAKSVVDIVAGIVTVTAVAGVVRAASNGATGWRCC